MNSKNGQKLVKRTVVHRLKNIFGIEAAAFNGAGTVDTFIQPRSKHYIRFLNQPYVNEVILIGQIPLQVLFQLCLVLL